MRKNYTNRYHSICSCESPQHTVHWQYDIEDDEVFFDVSLTWNNSFFTRVKKAVQYIFGHRSVFGHFDCFILENEEKEELISFLQRTNTYFIKKVK